MAYITNSCRSETLRFIARATSCGWRKAPAQRQNIENACRQLLGVRTDADYREKIASQTAVVTFLAGVGSRWQASIEPLKGTDAIPAGFETDMPRCLYPVDDLAHPGRKVPIGTYNLRAVAGLGKHYIIWGTHLDQIREMVENCGIGAVYVNQSKRGFKDPLNHGDGMLQAAPFLGPEIKYVITTFGGDASSRQTPMLSLLVLAALQEVGKDVRPWSVIPSVIPGDYPIDMGENGYPLGFGHLRLKGYCPASGTKPSNVGIRVYCKDPLVEALSSFYEKYYCEGTGYTIPGNEINDCALDNVDGHFAVTDDGKPRKRVRILNCALPEEAVKVKKFEELPSFMEAQSRIAGK